MGLWVSPLEGRLLSDRYRFFFKPIRYSGTAINVTNNGLFGSTGLSQTYTIVGFALHRAAVE
jgi:hypothetical protein